MKLDAKSLIIIVLVGIIGVLAGVMIGQSKNPSQYAANVAPTTVAAPVTGGAGVPADDGKLSKQYKKEEILGLIKANAKDLQKCYFSLLDKKPKVTEGDVNVLLKIQEDGLISAIRVTRNEFNDEDIASCVVKKLNKKYVAPPPYGINRNIAHVISFKTEETAKREAKERAEKNKPPKILPVE